MKLSVNRSELAEALGIVTSVTSPRTTKPVLRCVLIEAFDDFVRLSATDLEIGVQFHVTQVEVGEGGSILVAADKLGQIVRESGDEILQFETDDAHCHVRGADSHFQIFVQDPKEFPPVAGFEGDADFEIDVPTLRRMTEWTVFASAKENTRYAINGVLWDKRGESLTVVATDGRRLSKAVHRLEGSEGDQWAIVPARTMNLINRTLTQADAKVSVKIASNQILLKTPRFTISSVLLEGHFPKYEDVIPSDCDKRITFDTEKLLSAVRRAALLANDESKGVRCAFSEGTLTLSSRAPEQGEAVVSLPVTYSGGDLEIGFNPVFLTDVLRVVEADTVDFEFKESNRPGVFRCGDDFTYVVMPVTLS
jgi:DNA polymerase III subunit beta